jgi:hypothetical protein
MGKKEVICLLAAKQLQQFYSFFRFLGMPEKPRICGKALDDQSFKKLCE